MILHILDLSVYLLLSGLGIYFIHQGEMFDRFLKKRTYLAEFYEKISELPTILTYIEFNEKPMDYLKYGSDFNISIEVERTEVKNLTHGQNIVQNSLLTLTFDEQMEFSSNLGEPAEKRQVCTWVIRKVHRWNFETICA